MQDHQYPPNDTQPNRKRGRKVLRSFLMILIAGLVLLLILSLLSTLVNPVEPESKAPPTQAISEATQPPEQPQPAVVPEGSTSQDGSAAPQTVQETGNQFIDASGSSSGLFGQLSQEALSDFQTCADELEFTARIDDVWDIWEMIFYTVYTDQDNVNTTPPACQQLAVAYASNGRAEFIRELGGRWWPRGTLPVLLNSPFDAACWDLENCRDLCASETGFANDSEYDLYQQVVSVERDQLDKFCKAFEAYLFIRDTPIPSGYSSMCYEQLLPDSLCYGEFDNLATQCAEELDLSGAHPEVIQGVRSIYSTSYGDVPIACQTFLVLNTVGDGITANVYGGIGIGARCASGEGECSTIEVEPVNLELAQQCAEEIQWSKNVGSENDTDELVGYLAASAPWLQPGAIPSSCTQLLLSASPTEAGRAYWELLGKTLSERRIDTAP